MSSGWTARCRRTPGNAFVDMRITEVPQQTVLDGEVLDESHLQGIIAQLQTLGITVVSVHPVP